MFFFFFSIEFVWGSSVFLGICPSHLELQTSWAGTLSPCPLLFDVCSILTEAPPLLFLTLFICVYSVLFLVNVLRAKVASVTAFLSEFLYFLPTCPAHFL